MIQPNPSGETLLGVAQDFWTWWQVDPDADFMIRDPREAITNTLVRQGAHPIEADWLCTQALDTVCRRDALLRESKGE